MNPGIMIIEDNVTIREGFAGAIESSGKYRLTGAYGNCEAAFKKLEQDVPDLVLMDIELPGIDGIEGTQRIKRRLPDCIVLIITVVEDGKKVFSSLCAGAGGYIIKNSGNEDIIKNIDEAFAGGAPMSLPIAMMVVESFRRRYDSPLSSREEEVLKGISEGKSYSKLALDLYISKETVRTHIKNIYQKLAVNSKEAALKVAGDNKWLP